MTQDTSLSAYEIAKAKLHECQLAVFNFIADHPGCCNLEISDALNWPINRVTGRVMELRQLGLVHFNGPKIARTGMTVKSWRAHEWARRYPSGKAMPKAVVKPAAAQLDIPGVANSFDY